MSNEHFSVKHAAIQGGFLGIASGNIVAAPYIGNGSVFWFLFVFLMLVSSAVVAFGNRFVHVGVVALISLPVLFLWQSIHKVQATNALLLIEVAYLVVASQVAAGLIVFAAYIRRR